MLVRLAQARGHRLQQVDGEAWILLDPLLHRLLVDFDDGGVGALLSAIGCELTVCPDADTGMGASLVHAIRASLPRQPASWLVALGDMPHVAPATLRQLSAADRKSTRLNSSHRT